MEGAVEDGEREGGAQGEGGERERGKEGREGRERGGEEGGVLPLALF